MAAIIKPSFLTAASSRQLSMTKAAWRVKKKKHQCVNVAAKGVAYGAANRKSVVKWRSWLNESISISA